MATARLPHTFALQANGNAAVVIGSMVIVGSLLVGGIAVGWLLQHEDDEDEVVAGGAEERWVLSDEQVAS